MSKRESNSEKLLKEVLNERIEEFTFNFKENLLKNFSKFNPNLLKITLNDLIKIVDTTIPSSTDTWNTAASITSSVRSIRRSLSAPEFQNPQTVTNNIELKKSRSVNRNINIYKTSDRDVFKTPMTCAQNKDIHIVTPKVDMSKPIAIMRKPFDGEHAISIRGSPLMIDRVLSDKQTNLNIPLSDGRVMSILPVDGLRKSQVPELDNVTKHELYVIRKNIDLALKAKPK